MTHCIKNTHVEVPPTVKIKKTLANHAARQQNTGKAGRICDSLQTSTLQTCAFASSLR